MKIFRDWLFPLGLLIFFQLMFSYDNRHVLDSVPESKVVLSKVITETDALFKLVKESREENKAAIIEISDQVDSLVKGQSPEIRDRINLLKRLHALDNK